MRFSTLPPLIVALALLFGGAAQYPGPTGAALGAVGFLVLGCWITLELGSEILSRWQRARKPPEGPQ